MKSNESPGQTFALECKHIFYESASAAAERTPSYSDSPANEVVGQRELWTAHITTMRVNC